MTTLMLMMMLGVMMSWLCVRLAWKYTKKFCDDDDFAIQLINAAGAIAEMMLMFWVAKTLIVTPLYCYQMERMGALENSSVYYNAVLQENRSVWVNWEFVETYFTEEAKW